MKHANLSDLHWWRAQARLRHTAKGAPLKSHGLSVFEALVKEVSRQRPVGTVLFDVAAAFADLKRLKPQGDYILTFLFIDCACESVAGWLGALQEHLADQRNNFELLAWSEPERRSGCDCLQAATDPPRELCLEFLTPLPFRAAKRFTYLDAQQFLGLIDGRVQRLFSVDAGVSKRRLAVRVVPYYWHFEKVSRLSHSEPGTTQYLKGCLGKLYVKGELGELLPWLRLCEEIHLGGQLAFGMGRYRLHTEPVPYFAPRFPQREEIAHCVELVLERHDEAAALLASEGRMPFDPHALAAEIALALADGSYQPRAPQALRLPKKDGSRRVIERFAARDLIVAQYLHRLLAPILDGMFEESSIGYRKGYSRELARERVQSLLREGYCYVLESDIEDFFPSVSVDRLLSILDGVLPAADTGIRTAIERLLRVGSEVEGFVEPRRGLAQGNPLSPLLANLYLDIFDEALANAGARLIRYADDFVVLTKTWEDAERLRDLAGSTLATLGLGLHRGKTAVKAVGEGFRFLGMEFGTDASTAPVEVPLTKPLYMTEAFAFLGMNGDALEIRKGGGLVATFPLRRISEIIGLGPFSFSSSVVRKCAEHGVPLTLSLDSGYHVATFVPDSKRYFDTAYLQGVHYHALSATERLSFAKEFAAGKIRGYCHLFETHYVPGTRDFTHELDRLIDAVHSATEVPQIRGLEGAAARKVRARLNTLIDEPAFRVDRRERKAPDCGNSLLNFGYYLLFTRVNTLVRSMGLNPYLGFLHEAQDDYEALVCDVEELFRVHVDRLLLRLVNRKTIRPEQLSETPRGMRLVPEAVRRVVEEFEAELQRPANPPLSLADAMYAQVRNLKLYFTEGTHLGFYAWGAKCAA